MKDKFVCILLLIMVLLATVSVAIAQVVQPLPRAHAHNDYEHERPLLDALERGFGSVEVDVYLVDGALLVAHDLEDVDPSRTIQSLYLDPLVAWIDRNQGVVHPDAPPLVLLVDIKSEAEATYGAIRDVLKGYSAILTRFENGKMHEGAVTAIISGNRPREMMKAEPVRWAAYDGRLEDLENHSNEGADFIPLISSNWNQIASWYGVGELDESARKKLTDVIRQTHEQGRKIRFWATSNNPVVWEVLYEAGVDYLNADDLEGLQTFLLGR